MSKSKEYKTWTCMKQRCYDKSHISYPYYGKVGIRVCERWKSSFQRFYEDMGDRPPNKTLDRINPTDDYYPDNCRWATQSVQVHNQKKGNGRLSKYKGVTYHKNHNVWQSTITKNYKNMYLGSFSSEEDAAIAYNVAAQLFHGDLANLNPV